MASNKYLDFTGLSHFLDKIKSIFAPKKQGVEYINGTQSASTNAWTGETADNELYEGKMIAYRLPFAGTSSGATLNLTFANGTTSGAKNVYLSTSTRMTTHVGAGNTIILVYHEANVIGSTTYQGWWMDAYYNSNDSAYHVFVYGGRGGHTVTNCPPACIFLTQSETMFLPTWAGTANSTAATHVMTTDEFDPFGNIYYKSASAYNAGALIGQALWYQVDVDLRYAFNTNGFDLLDNGIGTTIYMVCRPTTNGKAVLHSNPITKTLPIEDDGLLYVYLGRSYSSSAIFLMLNHPVYMFDAEAGEAIAIDRSYLLDRDKNRIVTESDPYIYRRTGDGKAIGDIEVLDKIVGGTVCWNQLLIDGDFPDNATAWATNGSQYGSVAISGGVLTLTVGSTPINSLYASKNMGTDKLQNDHVILLSIDVNPSAPTTSRFLHAGIASSSTIRSASVPANVWTNRAVVVKMVADTSGCPFYVNALSELSTGDTVQIRNYHIHDLTQMFGSTIADYIYSLEQATAGAGVAWFKRYFPNEYYAYNPGELISATGLQEHKTVGKNLFDESVLDSMSNHGVSKNGDSWVGSVGAWISTNVTNDLNSRLCFFENTSYTIVVNGSLDTSGTTNVKIRFFYTDGSYVDYVDSRINAGSTSTMAATSDSGKTISKIGFTYGSGGTSSAFTVHHITLSIHDSLMAYEPYVSNSTALDPDVKLRGIFSLDSANKLTSDGDIWTPDGKIERRYAEVDLGTLEWVYFDIEGNRRFAANMSSLKVNGIARCSKYTSASYGDVFTNVRDKICAVHNQYAQFVVCDSEYSSAEAFKTAMSGVKLVYELAEPVIEDAPTYSSMQKADPNGTEEFVSNAEIKIPVGHSTRYMLAPRLYDETQQQLMAVQKAIEGEFVSAKNEQTFTPTQQLQARENIGATGIEWIQSTQTATTDNWTGISRDARLYDGKIICYRLSQPGSGNASLNLTLADGTETGPIPVYWHSSTRLTTHQASGTEWLYIYHDDYTSPSGTHYGAGWWSLNRAYYTDSYPSYSCREYTSPRAKSALYRYMLCFSDVDTKLIPANGVSNSTATTKTLTTESFDPFGKILYYGSTSTISAGNAPGENTLYYTCYSFDLRYSFNTGSTLTARQPVYVVCEPQDDGRVKLAENPIVQTIPLEEDGLVYIYLGEARSTSAICLSAYHDIYKVYNGAIYNIKALMLN